MKHFQQQAALAAFVITGIVFTLIAIYCIEQLVSAAFGGTR